MPTRRTFFRSSAALTAATLGASAARASASSIEKAGADPAYTIKNHHLKQSVMGWCFKPMDIPTLAHHAKDIGLAGMEGIDPKYYKDVMALGLGISLVGSHGFAIGRGQAHQLHQPRR
jgi:hypothetical protein